MSARDLSALPDEALLARLGAGVGEAPEAELLAAADTLDRIHPTPADLTALHAQPVACVTTRYRCPWCRRFSRTRKAAVADHMTRCWLNPAVRACKTCRFFQPGNRAGLAAYCYDGELCACGVVDEECLHSDGPELDAGLRDHCPLWALRGGEPR